MLIKLQGVGLSVRPDNEPQESVYQDIDDMGMNVLRLVFRQSYFYSDDSFSAYNPKIWEWIDKSIGLAKKYDKVLIIHLGRIHGAQFVPRIDVPYDYSIWHDQKKQELFINLWKEIAKRYHKEEIIAGYSLFLEPVCENTTQEWTVLANKTIDNIRKVDTNHLIFIERTYGEFKLRREISGIELAMDNAFPKISDNNFGASPPH